MAIPFVRFAYEKKMFSGAAALYVLIAVALPVLCLWYNPYSVMEAGRRSHFEDYECSPHGLMIVGGKKESASGIVMVSSSRLNTMILKSFSVRNPTVR